MLRIRSITARPLRVPLVEPFVIASGTMHETRAVEIEMRVEGPSGDAATGLGEAATLAPVTQESDDAILDRLARAKEIAIDRSMGGLREASAVLDIVAARMPVFRAGLEAALADAVSRLAGVPAALLIDERASPSGIALRTDITLPITRDPEHAVRLATEHAARGFDRFKVKVGIDRASDVRALHAVLAAVPGSRVRIDANGGYASRDALALLDALGADRERVECFEQPCGKHDLVGMAEVTKSAGIPVVADESIGSDVDLDAILSANAATGVNLKLVKLGGLIDAYRIGMRARAEGLSIMAGAMVETRLGLVAMAHVVWAIGGVDWVDLDTAFLLADDPYDGGWTATGPDIVVHATPGFGVTRRRKE
jgi:L-alanine-DL-glutamate epimerase-like enolase superfamily enzyme